MFGLSLGSRDLQHPGLPRRDHVVGQRIQGEPRGPLCLHLPIDQDNAGEPTAEATDWPATPATEDFLAARETYLARNQGGEQCLVSEAADFRDRPPGRGDWLHR